MADYYDKAVEYLTKKPGEIFDAWDDYTQHRAGKLFSPVSPNRRAVTIESNRYGDADCGCLTQIRSNPHAYKACSLGLTEAIISDERIPTSPTEVKIEHLPVFAEWQRRIDAELGREPPVWSEA